MTSRSRSARHLKAHQGRADHFGVSAPAESAAPDPAFRVRSLGAAAVVADHRSGLLRQPGGAGERRRTAVPFRTGER